jgi:hypothetical protein
MLSRQAYALAIAAMPALLAGCAAPSLPRLDATPPSSSSLPRTSSSSPQVLEPSFAPGALNLQVTQANIAVTICAPGWTASIRPPASFTNRLKREQMPLYGYPARTDPRSVEEDHREPLEIGGAPRDPRNLWPQPVDEAQAKDRLENAVKRDVCAGRLTLQQGQAIFLGDFWREYARRFPALSSLSSYRSVVR